MRRTTTVARSRDADARQVGTQPSARAVDAMTAGALRAEDPLAVLGVAARRIGRRRGRQRAQVGEDLPDLVVVACAGRPASRCPARRS